MKLREMMVTVCALLSVAWLGCNGAEDPESEEACLGCVVEGAGNRPLSMEAARSIGNRADAAFETLNATGGHKTRFESRIGPQPWPSDLPEDWPTPRDASVVADTKGRDDGRLLLIDLSISIDRALDSYLRALRDNGFEVARPARGGGRNSLRARSGRTEASLHFFARDDSTRLEILFTGQ